MADYRAITAVSQAIIELLEEAYQIADFDNHQLEFKAYVAKQFADPLNAGVSLFL